MGNIPLHDIASDSIGSYGMALSTPNSANFDDSADDHIVNGPALRCNFIVYTAILAEPNVYNAKNRSIQLLF